MEWEENSVSGIVNSLSSSRGMKYLIYFLLELFRDEQFIQYIFSFSM